MTKQRKTETIDSKYIQQHLANERTYLAWIRTSLAIIGIGFLVTNMHFSSDSTAQQLLDNFVYLIGIFSVTIGILSTVSATVSYHMKKKQINAQTFRSTGKMISLLSIFIVILALIFGLYFFLL